MSDHTGQPRIGQTRIFTAAGVTFLAVEPLAEVERRIQDAAQTNGFVELTSVTGQTAFPPEQLRIRPTEICAVQELSQEGWIWQQRADELHYARVLQDSPGEQMAAAQQQLVEALKGDV